MATAGRKLAYLVELAERQVDRASRAVARVLGAGRAPYIAPYLGYGSAQRVFIHARVLEQDGVRAPLEGDSKWQNLRLMYLRFASGEVPGAEVEVQLGVNRTRATTDEEGFLRVELVPEQPLACGSGGWCEVQLRLAADSDPRRAATARVLLPSPTAQFGVISDLDDTVLHTNVESLFRMVRIVYAGNARTRMPFAGVAAFYRALQTGGLGVAANPIFYVSSSPWNLYDLLHDFLQLAGIPLGPLLLRDWGITQRELLPFRHAGHKLTTIRQIMDFYPNLPFLLIGDSGQEDPEIYMKLVRQYGDRVLAVYIRNVSRRRVTRPEAIRRLFNAAQQTHTPLLLVEDTHAAAAHAAQQGWIAADVVPAIAAEIRKDQRPSQPGTDMVNELDRPAPEP
jgi:phosphatidate phosphatase APP1